MFCIVLYRTVYIYILYYILQYTLYVYYIHTPHILHTCCIHTTYMIYYKYVVLVARTHTHTHIQTPTHTHTHINTHTHTHAHTHSSRAGNKRFANTGGLGGNANTFSKEGGHDFTDSGIYQVWMLHCYYYIHVCKYIIQMYCIMHTSTCLHPFDALWFWFSLRFCSTLLIAWFYHFFGTTILAQHGDQYPAFSVIPRNCWFYVLLRKHKYHLRGVAEFSRLPLAPHRCEGLTIKICNTSAVILLVLLLPWICSFSLLCRRTLILIPMQCGSDTFSESEITRHFNRNVLPTAARSMPLFAMSFKHKPEACFSLYMFRFCCNCFFCSFRCLPSSS